MDSVSIAMEGLLLLQGQVLFLLRGRENFTYWTPQTSKGLGIKESLFDCNKFWEKREKQTNKKDITFQSQPQGSYTGR